MCDFFRTWTMNFNKQTYNPPTPKARPAAPKASGAKASRPRKNNQ